MWADGIYVKAGLERDKAAVLVVIGAMRDGSKEVPALVSGYRESVESWSGVLRDLRARGIGAPRLPVDDGNAAIWGAARQIWPEACEQRCWNHKTRNVLDRLPQREQAEAKDLVRKVAYAATRADAVKARRAFSRRYESWYPKAVKALEDNWDRMVAFYDSPKPTGSTCEPRTSSKVPLRACASGRAQRSGSSGLRAPRPSSGSS